MTIFEIQKPLFYAGFRLFRRSLEHEILSPSRLPIPSYRRIPPRKRGQQGNYISLAPLFQVFFQKNKIYT